MMCKHKGCKKRFRVWELASASFVFGVATNTKYQRFISAKTAHDVDRDEYHEHLRRIPWVLFARRNYLKKHRAADTIEVGYESADERQARQDHHQR